MKDMSLEPQRGLGNTMEVGSVESCEDQSERHGAHALRRKPPLEYLAWLDSHPSKQNTKIFHSYSRYTYTSLVSLDARYVFYFDSVPTLCANMPNTDTMNQSPYVPRAQAIDQIDFI